jgi:hypothetical protein
MKTIVKEAKNYSEIAERHNAMPNTLQTFSCHEAKVNDAGELELHMFGRMQAKADLNGVVSGHNSASKKVLRKLLK